MCKQQAAMLELTTGNLLEADVEAFVNTVNTEGVMGKGIALQFSKKFPEMAQAYQQACKAGEVRPGHMHVFERGDMLNPRYLINFPTKRHWRSPSRMEDIEAGLTALVEEIRRRGIRSIAVPPLGCGNGGLDWRDVRPAIERALGAGGCAGAALSTRRGAGGWPHGAQNGAACHESKPGHRVEDFGADFTLGYQLTLLEVHKLLYFLQEAGEPLRLRFAKDHYGPYADNLRHLLHRFPKGISPLASPTVAISLIRKSSCCQRSTAGGESVSCCSPRAKPGKFAAHGACGEADRGLSVALRHGVAGYCALGSRSRKSSELRAGRRASDH